MGNHTSPGCFISHLIPFNPPPAFNPSRMFEVFEISPGELEVRLHPDFNALLQSEANMFIGNLKDAQQKMRIETMLHERVRRYFRG
jgi:hypothetical protein